MSEHELDAACKALWECETHKMLAMGGYPVDYESQPETIKLHLRRQVRAVLQNSPAPAVVGGEADQWTEFMLSEALATIENDYIEGDLSALSKPSIDRRYLCVEMLRDHFRGSAPPIMEAETKQLPKGLIEFLDYSIKSKQDLMRVQEVREHIRDLERWKAELLALVVPPIVDGRHTPEPIHHDVNGWPTPWRLDLKNGGLRGVFRAANSKTVAIDMAGETYAETVAFFRRIVACVNACAGIDTDWLESMASGAKTPPSCGKEHQLILWDRVNTAEQQRDRLLSALRNARYQLVGWQGEPTEHSCSIHRSCMAEIDAAIAAASGECREQENA